MGASASENARIPLGVARLRRNKIRSGSGQGGHPAITTEGRAFSDAAWLPRRSVLLFDISYCWPLLHATCGLGDYLFGSPLGSTGRHAHARLQPLQSWRFTLHALGGGPPSGLFRPDHCCLWSCGGTKERWLLPLRFKCKRTCTYKSMLVYDMQVHLCIFLGSKKSPLNGGPCKSLGLVARVEP